MSSILPGSLAENLRRALAAPLPGRAYQERMLPEGRRGRRIAGPLRPSAVLAAILEVGAAKDGGPALVLIERAPGGPHGGQFALPGGHEEASDDGPVGTALREASEEVGLRPGEVEVLGLLSPLEVAVSRSLIRPVVGLVSSRPSLVPSPAEVVSTLEFPLAALLDPATKALREVYPVDGPLLAPCYLIDGKVVWGATAMILSELEELLRRLIARA